MRIAKLKNREGNIDEFKCYTVEEFPYWQMPTVFYNCHSKGNNKPECIYKMFATFDIETTTIIPEDEHKMPYGFMYHWQMDIGGVIVYGRRWEEWIELLKRIRDWLELDEKNVFYIYIHNLSFEFQFMKNIIRDYLSNYTVFATGKRQPLNMRCDCGFIFACSYKLSNMSLAKAIENELGTKHLKAAGDLDYKKMRTADTELDDTEYGYCIADVVGLYEYIQCKLKNEHDTLESIPMTSTGFVRRDCRLASRKEKHYRDNFLKTKINKDVWILLKEAGRGGNTHANRKLSNHLIKGVLSNDVASSYPYQMLAHEMPMTKFTPYGDIDTIEEFEELLNTKACLFRITFFDIELLEEVTIPYIPYAKCRNMNRTKCDNGRIMSADVITITLTDVDYKIIEKQYIWSDMIITDMHIATYGMLPGSIRGQVMNYFKQKTELKHKIEEAKENHAPEEEIENLQYLYAKSKNRLNGIFGMCYTDPVHCVYTENNLGEWTEELPDPEDALEKYYKSRNSFLSYAWGVWITAWARAHLQDLLDATSDFTIYCDTDSDKYIANRAALERINKLNDEIIRICEEKGIYADAGGKRYYLGVYESEYDTPLDYFKTLGAKKYAYVEEGKLHITIAGVQKKLGAVEMGSIDNFKIGFIFHEAGGNTLYYNDEAESSYITIDGCRMLTGSNIGITDSTYKLGVTNEYAELLGINIYEEMR